MDTQTVTKLTQNLFVANADAVGALPNRHPYDEVVTLGYMDILGNDHPAASTTGDQYKFRDGPHDYEQFEAAAKYVINKLDSGEKVLVHCQAGVSRSPTICITAIATRQDRELNRVRATVEKKHPPTNPEPRVWESAVRFVKENR